MLVDDSLWSRGLFRLRPITHSDLMSHLGQHLSEAHSDILDAPLPRNMAEMLDVPPAILHEENVGRWSLVRKGMSRLRQRLSL